MSTKKPSVAKAQKQLDKVQAKRVPKAKAKTKKPQPTKIDWTLAQKDFLMDATLTYSDIAKMYQVSKNSVTAAAKRMGWIELRNNLSETATNLMIRNLAEKKAAANGRHVENYVIVQEKIMEAVKAISAHADPGDLNSLAKALKTATDGERVALGLPTLVNAIADTDGRDFASAFADAWLHAKRGQHGDGSQSTE